MSKHIRLKQLEELLISHPDGLRRAEIARRLGVNRSTIGRDVDELRESLPFVDEEDGRVRIDLSRYAARVELNIHEAMALHLAMAALASVMDRNDPDAGEAMKKLAAAVAPVSDTISETIAENAGILSEGRRKDVRFLRVLRELTEAWRRKKRAKIRYMASGATARSFREIDVYTIHPYRLGRTIHVIAYDHSKNDIRSFRLDRIEDVQALSEQYVIPDDFHISDYLQHSWGVWTGDQEPELVRLRFAPAVARRVQESTWHQSETTSEEPDGSLIWEARIAEPREMYPWIRGWGPDVEVLEPQSLRAEAERDAQAVLALYRKD